MNFFNELKRRNVFRVGAAYLVIAWLLTQVVGTLGGIFALPDAFGRSVVILLAIGFPIALIVSWVYEVSSQGVVTQVAVDAGTQTTSGRKLNAVIVAAMALVLVFLVIDNYVLDTATPTTAPNAAADSTTTSTTSATVATTTLEKSIAVLPFANLSSDPEQEYFSDGLTDELINKLSQVRELLVIGRNSSFYFKGRNESLQEIGTVLDVAYLLQGSVRKAGTSVRVTAQLMEAGSGFNLWSRTYDRAIDDIFTLQDEIADEVTTALSVSLGVGAFSLPGMTRDVAAYDAYLKAQAILRNDGLEPLQALAFIQQALALDPQFAQAWLAQADIYLWAAVSQPGDQAGEYGRMRQESLATAAALAPAMPGVLNIQAEAALQEGDLIEADRLYRELLATDAASLAEVNRQFGSFLRNLGKVSEALPYLQRARRLNPVGGTQDIGLANTLLALNRIDEAVAAAEQALAAGDAVSVQFLSSTLWMAAFARHDPAQAIAYLERLPANAMERDYVLPVARALAEGDPDTALATVQKLATNELSQINTAALIAAAAVAGAADLAAELEAATPRSVGLQTWQPITSNMRKTATFKQKVIDAGWRDYFMATGWNDFCRPLPDTEDDFECF